MDKGNCTTGREDGRGVRVGINGEARSAFGAGGHSAWPQRGKWAISCRICVPKFSRVGSWLRKNAEATKAFRIAFPTPKDRKRRRMQKFLALFAVFSTNCFFCPDSCPVKLIQDISRNDILANFRPYTFSRNQGRKRKVSK